MGIESRVHLFVELRDPVLVAKAESRPVFPVLVVSFRSGWVMPDEGRLLLPFLHLCDNSWVFAGFCERRERASSQLIRSEKAASVARFLLMLVIEYCRFDMRRVLVLPSRWLNILLLRLTYAVDVLEIKY